MILPTTKVLLMSPCGYCCFHWYLVCRLTRLFKLQSLQAQQNCYSDTDLDHSIFFFCFGNNINFQPDFSLKWTSIVTRNAFFLQSKPYLQKHIARKRSNTDHDGEAVSVHLSWYQYMSFAVKVDRSMWPTYHQR